MVHGVPVVVAVDDDAAMLECLALLLEDHFDVLTAPTGAAALTLLREHAVDAVVLDLLMPGMDGLEVLQAIKAFDARIEVIVVTAVRSAHLAVAAMKYGAFEYVTKPFDEDELLALLISAVERRRAAGTSATVPSRRMRGPTQQGGPVFLIGTQPGALAVLQSVIERHFLVRTSLTAAGAVRLLAECVPAVVIIDPSFPAPERRAVLHALGQRAPLCLVIADENQTGDRAADHAGGGLAKPTPLGCVLRQIAAVLDPGQLPAGFPPPMNAHVLDALEYVGRNHTKPIGLRAAAAAGGISPRHLAHLFRDDVGISLMEYVAKIRIEAAKALLAKGDLPLEQVADSVGFSDASHLSRVFVQYVGERPGRYRSHRPT